MSDSKTESLSSKLPHLPSGRFPKGIHPATQIRKGQHLSLATEFKKGHIPWSKGRKGVSKGLLAWAKQNPDYNKGRLVSEETRRRISLAVRGFHHSSKARNKMSKTKKWLYAEGKIVPWNKGGHQSLAAREKMSRWRKGRPTWWMRLGLPQNPKREKKANTKPELRFEALCRCYNLPFEHVASGEFWIEKVNPDFINREHKIAVFIDGCYWHGCPIHYPNIRLSRKRDAYASLVLRRNGWRKIRIWEHDLNNVEQVKDIARQVEKFRA